MLFQFYGLIFKNIKFIEFLLLKFKVPPKLYWIGLN